MMIDILLLVFAAFGFMVGFSRGIIKTVFTILSYSLGVIAAIRFSPAVTNILKELFDYHNAMMFIAGFLISFLLTMFLLRLFARGLEGALETANINIINQVAGGTLISAFSILVYSVFLSFFLGNAPANDPRIADSRTYEYLKEYPAQVWKVAGKLKDPAKRFWNYAIDMMDQVENLTERTDSENYFYDLEDDGEAVPNEGNN